MKEKLLSKKAGISYFEIIILIVASFSFSYFVYESSKIDEVEVEADDVEQDEPINNNILTILSLIINSIKKPIIPEVSATSGMYTCKETKNGAKCQEYVPEQCDENCKETCYPGSREDYSECVEGCCINPDGKCIANSNNLASKICFLAYTYRYSELFKFF